MTDVAESGLNRRVDLPAQPMERSSRQWWVLFLVAGLVFGADQFTKHLVRTRLEIGEGWPSLDWFVHFEHVTNTGAAFSILQNQGVFLIVTSLIGLGAIVLYFAYPPFHHPLLRVAFGMQLGGAVGNLLDRIRTGSVTDFIKFRFYPTFNVADSCIVVGVLILAWFLLFRGAEKQRKGGT